MIEHPGLTKKRVRELRQTMSRGDMRHAAALATTLHDMALGFPARIEQGKRMVVDQPHYLPYLNQVSEAKELTLDALGCFIQLFDGPEPLVRIAEVIFDAEVIGDDIQGTGTNPAPGREV